MGGRYHAIAVGMWVPLDVPADGNAASCQRGNIFAPRSHCIAGYGCDTGGRR